jgi:tetratricopeptide (TPR) repeat protein
MSPHDTIEKLRTALAGRYDIERELGRGGMATVYLAHDRKHGRALAIKVLRPELAEALGAERFLREIQIAANLTHPHILPLHDSGDADGLLYYVMPYVAGESLRALIEREKQLPIEEAVRVTGQVLSALTHAHSRGIIHRDIKPENILLADGEAVVADFGIARAIGAAREGRITQAGTSLGTPGYMSPEQVVGDADLDARSDVYAVGCMLYEMLVGEPPFTGPMEMVVELQLTGKPTPPSARRSTVTPELDAVIAKALQKTPADRFATAAQFGEALERVRAPAASAPHRARPASRLFAAGFTVALLVILAGAGAMLLSFGGIPFADRDWIVVAQFDNQTGDGAFDYALDAALSASIAQSKHVNVYPQTRVAETLARMRRPKEAHLDQALATEVAIREGVKVVLVPSISNLDESYTLTARVVDASSGVDLATATTRADGRGNVLTAVDQLARNVRRDLGETRFDLIQNGGWFARATTSSLDALKAFTEGGRAWSTGNLDRAQDLWKQAIGYDSTFAWAHASLGMAASWFNDRPAAEVQFAVAEAHLDQLTERERLWLRALIAGSRDRPQDAIDLLETYTRTYPDDRDAWYNLGSDYMRAGRCDDAAGALEHALAIDSTMTNAIIQMATCYNNVHEPDEAIPLYQRAFALDSNAMTSGFINHEYGTALVEAGRLPEAEATFQRAIDFTANRAQQFGGRRSLALLRMFEGRYDAAIDLLHEAVTMTRTTGNAGLTEYRNLLYLAAALRTKGDTAGFRAQLAAAERVRAHGLYVPPFLLVVIGKMYAQSGDLHSAVAVATTLDGAAGPNPTPDDRAAGELLGGEIALARGDTRHAIEQLELAATRDPRPYFGEALARAYARAGDAPRAIQQYERMLQHVEFGAEGQEPWILAHVELGQLYEAEGAFTKAVAAYQQFVDLWHDADPDLARSVAEIQRHIATLRKAHEIG